MADLVAQATESVRAAATAKNITISVQQTDDCPVRGDAGRLQQVVWNLLSNAIKFTPPGGSINVTVGIEERQVVLAVADTGAGIPRAFLPHVFDRFRQADQTSTRVHGGLGLGLSIVKHLVELHGGTVAASSDGPAKGARFTVRLPGAERAMGAPPVTSLPTASEISLAGRTIVIVDDDVSTREVVSAALEQAGADVRAAASAAEAWNALQESVPDILVADLAMPMEDGFSFMRRVRNDSKLGQGLPTIALSAFADARSEASARAAGFSAFRAKPARPEALLHLIDRLLKAHDRLETTG